MPKRHTEQSKLNTDDKHRPFELNRQSIARIISHAPFSLSRQDGAERQRHGGTAALEAAAPGLWRPAVSRGKHARRECRKRGDRRGHDDPRRAGRDGRQDRYSVGDLEILDAGRATLVPPDTIRPGETLAVFLIPAPASNK